MTVPTITLNNQTQIPQLGFGVFQVPPEQTADTVTKAFEVGYRHIDTAAAYGNERQVGEGIRRSGIDRADVFIETKVWPSDYGYDERGSSLLMGHVLEYEVVQVVDPHFTIAAKIPKSFLTS